MDRYFAARELENAAASLKLLLERIAGDCGPALEAATAACCQALDRGNKILFFGNGGSAAQAQHFAAELINRFQRDRRPLAALALVPDAAVTTAIGNDYTFEDLFHRQLSGLGRPGDIAIALTTSGTSANIINGLIRARELELVTIGFLGRDGGDCLKLCDIPLLVKADNTARIQEGHLLLGHLLCEGIENGLFA